MKKSNHIFFPIMASIIFIISCTNNESRQVKEKDNHLEGNISISGAFALYPLTIRWAEEFRKIHPAVRIDISAGGAGKGMTDVLSDMVDLAMFSREVSEEETKKGAWKVAVAKDAVLPTLNVNNPMISELMAKGITKELFYSIFINGRIKYWEQCTGKNNKTAINVFTRSDACGAAEMWGKYLGKNQESLKGIGVFGDPGMADAVKNDCNAIGYNNVNYVFDPQSRKPYEGLAIIPIDINGDRLIDSTENFYNSLDEIINAIRGNKYPSPPARELYLISLGKPKNKIVMAFLGWILNDGQQYINESGYVELPKEILQTQLKKITE